MVIEWLGGLRGERGGSKTYRVASAPRVTKSREVKNTALDMSHSDVLSVDRRRSDVTRRIFRRDIIPASRAGINLSQ